MNKKDDSSMTSVSTASPDGATALFLKGDKVAQAKKPLRIPPVPAIEQALHRTGGNVTAAARMLGIARTSLHVRIRKSEVLQRALQEEREALVDLAEEVLREEVEAHNITAVIWTLKASPEAKQRGWGERTEVAGANGGPLRVDHRVRVEHGSVDEVILLLAGLADVGAIQLPGLAEGDDSTAD